MTVGELKEFLKGVDDNTSVVIDGQVIADVYVVDGRLSQRDIMSGQRFVTNIQDHKKRDKALMFQYWAEISTGEQMKHEY